MSLFRGENPNLGQVSAYGYTNSLTVLSVSGAIPNNVSGSYILTKAGVSVMTLAKPTQDGLKVVVISNTANAHTITATGLLQTGSASVNVATFAASPGASVSLVSYGGQWNSVAEIGITFS